MVSLKGTKTEENLKTAFEGESKARTKYEIYADKAEKAGYVQIANIFREASRNEKIHATIWYDILHEDSEPTVEDELKDAISGEHHEWTQMYKDFAEIAKDEGFDLISAKFNLVGTIEKMHEERYQKLLDNLEQDKVFSRDEEVEWICENCGFVSTGKEAPKMCPVCGAKQAFFEIRAQNY